MYYSKISTGSSKSVRKEGNMRPRNTIYLSVLKTLCPYYSALGHVRGFPEAGNTKGPDWAMCESCRRSTTVHMPSVDSLLTCPFNSTSTWFSPLFLFDKQREEGGCVWISSPALWKWKGFVNGTGYMFSRTGHSHLPSPCPDGTKHQDYGPNFYDRSHSICSSSCFKKASQTNYIKLRNSQLSCLNVEASLSEKRENDWSLLWNTYGTLCWEVVFIMWEVTRFRHL